LSAIADAQNAIGRLKECFTAELISETLVQDPKLKNAVEIDNASFTWDGPPLVPNEDKGKQKCRSEAQKPAPTSEHNVVKEEILFKLKHIDLRIPRGELVAIVGVVGSGKTSLLQGLIGEMHRTEGSVRVGGSVAYCSQSAWIQVGRCDYFDKSRCTEFSSRMPPFATIFVSVDLSKQTGIGKPFMIPAWSLTLTCCPTVT
jgi:ABC-type multidrug transport system fused ATPase/permease subunit